MTEVFYCTDTKCPAECLENEKGRSMTGMRYHVCASHILSDKNSAVSSPALFLRYSYFAERESTYPLIFSQSHR